MADGNDGRLGGSFLRLWAASTTSALGSGLAAVATPLLVATRTDDPLLVSAATAVGWLPWLLFALPGGVLVDRVDRRRLMLAIDWARVAALVVLAAAVAAGRASTALLFIVLFVVATGEVVFRSASQALVPAVVPAVLLERANGWLFGGTMLMQQMVAGPLGGFLFVVAASIPFAVNAGTYAASALLLTLIGGTYRVPVRDGRTGVPTAVPAAGGGPWLRALWADVAEGFRWLAGQRLLRTMAVLIGLLNVTLTAATAVLVLLARDRLGLGSVGYGLLFTAMAVGGLLGAVAGDRVIAALSATWTIRIGLIIEAATHLVLATTRSAVLVGAVFVAFGVHGALWGIVASSLRQRLTPPEMLGRVGSTTLFLAAGGNCVGALLGGVLAGAFGLTAPYWVGFAVAVGVAATTWRVFDRSTVAAAYAMGAPATPASSGA
ncbi:Transmembrane secretion effector [Modestobacter sp. DSM 44400]|uniref:MFS transporter n=1 Tax=Modestobacter sp. DSM 44400 TaxID=1550230 RepID=UPI00089C57FB|nr:MFS transporter [Modestobacter sp. DSM 44400]SDX83566.1 Transmembrane secretion effector [Modestobacter sp. DSM 44400]